MKVGIRKPSIKKSFKARTTGMVNRKIKSSINPFYGKKGMGMVRDPKRSVNNAVYHRTTIGVRDIINGTSSSHKHGPVVSSTPGDQFGMSLIIFCAVVFLALGFISLTSSPSAAIFAFICSLSAFLYFVILRKKGY